MARILLIEDEAVLRTSLARGLRKAPGWSVDEAGSVEEAVELLVAAPPDIVLSDLDLPGRSGIEILGELGLRGIKVPVIFVSAYLKAYRSLIPRHADVEVVEKPVALEDLRQLVLARLGAGDKEGEASPFSVPDFLQLACMGRHSVAIDVREGSRLTGTILVSAGEIWSARDGAGRGPEALRRLLFSRTGAVSCRTLAELPSERDVLGGWQGVLLEAARQEDEESRPEPPTPSPAPAPRPAADAGFDEAWDEGVSALLKKEYSSALRAFRRAAELKPGDRKVEANLARLKELGFEEGGTAAADRSGTTEGRSR